MDFIAVALGLVGYSLLLALHGILVLRWCGQWSTGRRLVFWVAQMLFPWVTGPAVGGAVGWAVHAVVSAVASLSYALEDGIAVGSALLAATVVFCAPFLITIRRAWWVRLSPLLAAPPALAAYIAFENQIYIYSSWDIPLFIGLGLWHCVALPLPLLFARRVRKKRCASDNNLCLDCDYDLAGLTSDRCPECGARVKADQAGAAPCSTS